MITLKKELANAIITRKLDWELLPNLDYIKITVDKQASMVLIKEESQNQYKLVFLLQDESLKEIPDIELINNGLFLIEESYDSIPNLEELLKVMSNMVHFYEIACKNFSNKIIAE